MAVSGRMAATLNEQPGRVFVDSTGLGAGVLDRLRELGFEALPWVAAGRARNPGRFANIKAESWWHARARSSAGSLSTSIRLTGCWPRQLAGQRYSLTSAGLIQMVAKRDTAGPGRTTLMRR